MEPFAEEVRRLVDRLAGATPGWYDGRPDRSTSRAEALRGLVADLAALGARADTGQPADAVPNVLGDHALGDQLTVLAHELTTAPQWAEIADAARAAVGSVRTRL